MPNADHRSSENATQAELARIAERRTRPAQPSHTRIVVGELSSCTGSPMLLGRWALVSIALSATFSTTMSISSDLATPSFPPAEEDVSECLLLFGAYANGNLGDIVQSSTMARLMSNVASADTCIWHAHPSKESTAKGFREGEFFADNSAGLVSLGCDRESGEQVSRFKAFIIGGGGLFESKHFPLDCEDFVDGLRDDLPVAIFGVGASSEAILSAPIIRRANYLSGRDTKSVRELSTLVGTLGNATSRPEDIEVVRDPVLSDSYFQDGDGECWRESKSVGIDRRPLCFVLPSATKENLQNMHHIFSTRVVRRGDVLLNVFPKHQAEIEAYPYPSRVEQVMDPAEFATRLCECRAVVASRLHGAIIALQAGVPTIAVWPDAEGNKVPDLMKDVLGLPDQFLVVDNTFSRGSLMRKVKEVRKHYSAGRRGRVFEKLDAIALRTRQQSARMLADVAHVQLPERVDTSIGTDSGGFWRKMRSAHGSEENLEGEGRVATSLLEAANAPLGVEVKGEGPRAEGILSPWNRLTKSWRFGGRSSAPGVGDVVSYAGSVYVALAALIMIVALGLPRLAYRSRRESRRLQHVKASAFAFDNEAGLLEDADESGTFEKKPPCGSQLGCNQFQIADFAFFGLNYVLWVVLAMGFNVCSKTYLRETGNPVALLAIQGWVGIIVLLAMNEIAGSRRRSFSSQPAPFSPASCPATSPDSSSSPAPSPSSSSASKARFSPRSSPPWTGPSWAGKCGLREAKRLGQGVWQAGLFHSGNAVLTSWSVLVGGVAATHALKALEPVAAAGFSRWLLGSSLPPGRAVGVVIIVLGLGILMVPHNVQRLAAGGGAHPPDGEQGASEVFLVGGQDLALPAVLTACACCFVALRNVLLKKPDPPPPPPPLGLLACTITGAAVGSMALLVPWLPCSWEWAGTPLLRTSGINAALCAVGYNLASFNLLSELSPVGHAVGNASKRILLFASGLFLLGEEGSMSARQLTGALVAFVGLASYNLAGTFAKAGSRSLR